MKKVILTVALALIGHIAEAQSIGVVTYTRKERKEIIIGQWSKFRGKAHRNRVGYINTTDLVRDELQFILDSHDMFFEEYQVDAEGDKFWTIDAGYGYTSYVFFLEEKPFAGYSSILILTLENE
jgi:hypothetical protein